VSAWAQYTLRFADRDRVQKQLQAASIPTAIHYPLPLNQQPAVQDASAQVPHGDLAARQVLSLPMHPYLGDDDIARVVEAIGAAR
jgi:UDP-2-acetamido-2-deoxy-ribo-hexuluronate aminotransferase